MAGSRLPTPSPASDSTISRPALRSAAMTRGAATPDGLAGPCPTGGAAPCLRRRWLRGDLVAGVTVAALIVPKNLGYAGIAGIPLQNGLYAAAAGAILYAVFGTSRQISMGPSSGLAAVAASAVLAAGITGEQDVASFVAAHHAGVGRAVPLLAVLRMGWIAQFLSRAVVTGFLFGAAIDVVIGELPKLTGTDVDRRRTRFRSCGRGWGRSATRSRRRVVVGVVSLVVVFGLRRIAPRVPGRAGAGRRRAAGLLAVRPGRPRGRAGRRRAERTALVRGS